MGRNFNGQPEEGEGRIDRRKFLQLGATGLGVAVAGPVVGSGCTTTNGTSQRKPAKLGAPPTGPLAAPPIESVRIGFVGVGGMGTVHVRNLVRIPGCVITAVCDINESNAERARKIIEDAGHPTPRLYTRGERDFERMCAEEDLDLVYTATPWEWHVPVMLAAMENDEHAATEVPAAITLDECWAIVEAAEKYRKHCVMMENCNYDRPEMMVLNMVRQGIFGEILHGECGYLHDLRAIKFSDTGEGLWRRRYSIEWNANLYPTHGLGPIANCMDINRGDRFATIVSMAGPSRGLQQWAQEHLPEDDPRREEQYALGDVNLSLIKTARGRTIYVVHDTNLPRPYSRIHMVQGTRGLFQGYPNRIYIEGRSPSHRWEPADAYFEEFQHPLWEMIDDDKAQHGHGGMDYLEDYRLIYCLRHGLPTDMNVYDAAALSAVVELSAISIAEGSRPIEFPDFTREAWRTFPKLEFAEV